MSGSGLLGLDVGLIRRRGTIVAAAATIAAMGGLVAFGFAAWAAQIALAHRFEPEIAALIVAGIAALLALAAAVAAALVVARTRREVGRAVAASAVATLAPPAVSLALRHTRLAAVVTAVGVGFWLARRAR